MKFEKALSAAALLLFSVPVANAEPVSGKQRLPPGIDLQQQDPIGARPEFGETMEEHLDGVFREGPEGDNGAGAVKLGKEKKILWRQQCLFEKGL